MRLGLDFFIHIVNILFTFFSGWLFSETIIVFLQNLGILTDLLNRESLLTDFFTTYLSVIVFVVISLFNISILKPAFYALAYSYPVYTIMHADFTVNLVIKMIPHLTAEEYLRSQLIVVFSVFLSAVFTLIIPKVWEAVSSAFEYKSMAQQAGLFLARREANDMPLSLVFNDYLESIKVVNKLKFKCITGYHTFTSEESHFHKMFKDKIDLSSIDKIEILLANPDGNGIQRRARIIADSDPDITRAEVVAEFKQEIKNTLEFLNSLPYKEKIKIRFCNDSELKYKILVFNDVVLVQGYFGANITDNENIFGFQEKERTTSMYKIFCKLFDEKFSHRSTKKINQLESEYHGIFNSES